MPDKCSVPGCKGNYKSASDYETDKVSVSRFLKDSEMRVKWIWITMIP